MRSLRSLARALALTPALVAVACGGDDTTGPVDAPAAVTYYQDLKPIIDAKCLGCHGDGGIGPFSLDTVDKVTDMAGIVVSKVADRTMPPWPPNADCNQYFGDRSLSAEQIALFAAWADGGYQAGDPARPGPPLVVEELQLTRIDRTLRMDAPYTPQTTAAQPDEYRCFVIPWPEAATRYVTGFRAVPGNPKVVHHVIAFYAQPDQVATYQQLDDAEPGAGYTCFGGTGGPSQAWLGAWAPGSLGSDMPPGTGLEVKPGSAVILQVHYNVLAAGPEPDQTALEFKLDPTVTKVAKIQPWANPNWLGTQAMHIPANQADVTHSFEFDATLATGGPFLIYSAGLHMHTLGTQIRASATTAAGVEQCLLQIDHWNFHWQGSYGLRQPLVFNRGDKLKVECHWDNTIANQPVVGGQPRTPTDVYWGEGTTDEMCLGVFYVTPL
ncbi:MAG: hypothetical protein R3B06_03640 [Kofleriaceae bacterium]